jgi:hypothetical protein
VLVDLKTGDPEDSGCAYQTAAYLEAFKAEHPEQLMHERWARAPDAGSRVPYRITPYTDWQDFAKVSGLPDDVHVSGRRGGPMMSGDLSGSPTDDDSPSNRNRTIALEIEPEPRSNRSAARAALVSPRWWRFCRPTSRCRCSSSSSRTRRCGRRPTTRRPTRCRWSVEGAEGLQRADVALTALRTSLKAIDEHFEEPTRIANDLHKRLTGVRGEWQASGEAGGQDGRQRIFTEQRRLERLRRRRRRKAQAEADRKRTRGRPTRAAEAAKAQAPAPVVEEMKRQAETSRRRRWRRRRRRRCCAARRP